MSSWPAGLPFNQADFTNLTVPRSADYFNEIIKPTSDALGLMDGKGWGPWIDLQPYLINSWVAYGTVYAPPALSVKGNMVRCRGLIKSGSALTISSAIPSQYWPATNHYFMTIAGPGLMRIAMSSAGVIGGSTYLVTGNSNFVSLEPLHWTTD